MCQNWLQFDSDANSFGKVSTCFILQDKSILCDKVLKSNKMEDDLTLKLEYEQQLRKSLEIRVNEMESELENFQLVNIELTEALKATEHIKVNYEKVNYT